MADNQLSIEAFARLPLQQKLLSLISLTLVATLAFAGWNWVRTPAYSVLFSNLSERDGGSIVNALQQMAVPYKFNESGGAIMVPQNQVHDARLKLASQGLPKGGLVGFEIMETQKLGLSQFIEQINYQRALEGELSRSVQALAAVQGARVHLAMPKQSGFLRDEARPSASVLVNLHAGRTLEPGQVAGIVHLVAASVPHLPTANVNVVDQNGNLLSAVGERRDSAGLDPTQLKYMHEIEASYVRRIENILVPIVGPGNLRAQVTADIDFSQSEQVAETYKPNPAPDGSIRSQQISESGTGGAGAAGVPGALSNQPPVPATAPVTTPAAAGTATAAAPLPAGARRDATVNYELDKTIRHVRQPVGAIKRLSVAVVVNHRKDVAQDGKTTLKPFSTKEMAQINDLVKETMGYNKERGDTLNIANSPFTSPDKEVAPDTPIWKNPTLIGWAIEGLRYLLFAALAGYLFFGVVKPFLRRLMERAAAAPPPVAEGAEAVAGPPGTVAYDQKVEAARNLARQEPKAVANVIKEWVGGNQVAGKVQ